MHRLTESDFNVMSLSFVAAMTSLQQRVAGGRLLASPLSELSLVPDP